jgi:predicted enzyme related to lactoylglutathione lyase
MPKSSNDQRIDYIEFSVSDIARSRDFYGKAFGWSFKDYGPSYCEFNDGRLTGGFALAGEGNPGGPIKAGGPLVILYADDLSDTQRRVEEVGGEDRQACLFVPGRPPLPLRRSGQL